MIEGTHDFVVDHAANDWIRPEWPAPSTVRALMTTRNGGVSEGAYAAGDGGGGLDLGTYCGDANERVARNRAILRANLPSDPVWLRQVHGRTVIDAGHAPSESEPDADAAIATSPKLVCAVLVADCMPVLFCDRSGTRVAAAHAGWRGLAQGVLEATVAALDVAPRELLVWLGAAIGARRFEVGADVRDAFIAHDPSASSAFTPFVAGKWLADLAMLARMRLAACGVVAVYGGGLCTVSEPARFYSYRRDRITGRMAALIWLDS